MSRCVLETSDENFTSYLLTVTHVQYVNGIRGRIYMKFLLVWVMVIQSTQIQIRLQVQRKMKFRHTCRFRESRGEKYGNSLQSIQILRFDTRDGDCMVAQVRQLARLTDNIYVQLYPPSLNNMFAVISSLLLLSSVAAFAPQGKRRESKLFSIN